MLGRQAGEIRANRVKATQRGRKPHPKFGARRGDVAEEAESKAPAKGGEEESDLAWGWRGKTYCIRENLAGEDITTDKQMLAETRPKIAKHLHMLYGSLSETIDFVHVRLNKGRDVIFLTQACM